MNFETYQTEARKTAIYDKLNHSVIYPTLGLSGETGEIANKVQKVLRDNTEFPVDDLSREIGDCIWFLANLAQDLGLSLDTIAKENLKKLKSRQKRNKIRGSGDRR